MKRDTDHLEGVAVDIHRSPVHLHQGRENEISLIDLWLVLARRKYWVIAIFAISVATAIAVSLFMSPRYESHAVLSLGQVQGLGVLEQPDILLERLKREYQLEEDVRNDRILPYMESVEFDARASKRVFKFEALGRTPEEARDFLHKAVEGVVVAHQRLYEDVLRVQHERMSILDANLARFRQETDSLKAQRQHGKSLDGSEAVLVALERARLVVSVPALETEKLNLRLALMPPTTEPTQLLLEPILPKNASRPQPLLYAGIGVVIGVTLGLIAAFLAEFFAKARREMEVPGDSRREMSS